MTSFGNGNFLSSIQEAENFGWPFFMGFVGAFGRSEIDEYLTESQDLLLRWWILFLLRWLHG